MHLIWIYTNSKTSDDRMQIKLKKNTQHTNEHIRNNWIQLSVRKHHAISQKHRKEETHLKGHKRKQIVSLLNSVSLNFSIYCSTIDCKNK